MKRELNVKVREIVKPRMSVKPIKDGEELKRNRQKKKIFAKHFRWNGSGGNTKKIVNYINKGLDTSGFF